jgi:hypothetical protein
VKVDRTRAELKRRGGGCIKRTVQVKSKPVIGWVCSLEREAHRSSISMLSALSYLSLFLPLRPFLTQDHPSHYPRGWSRPVASNGVVLEQADRAEAPLCYHHCPNLRIHTTCVISARTCAAGPDCTHLLTCVSHGPSIHSPSRWGDEPQPALARIGLVMYNRRDGFVYLALNMLVCIEYMATV